MAAKVKAEGAEPKAKKEGGKLPIMPILGLVLLMNMLIVGKVFFMNGSAPKKGGETAAHKEVKPEVGEKITLEEFMLNLEDPDDRFVRCTVALGLKKAAKAKEIEEKEIAPIRDIILTVLMTRSRKELRSEAGRKKVKDEIRDKINAEMKEKPVVEVYFTNFATQ